MAPVRRSSSRALRLALAAGGLLTLAGCAANGPLLDQMSSLRLGTQDSDVAVTEAKPELRASIIEPASSQTVTGKAATAKIVPATAPRSHWCDYLREDTAAQTTILRSPTLSGSMTEEAQATVSLGVSLSSFAKAGLMEDAADVRCQKYLAENGLQKLVFVSPQGLTAAGHKAKLKSIDGQKTEIARLRKKVAMALNSGSIDRERATAISVLADQILAEADAARSQADRRLETTMMPPASADAYGAALLAAEADLEDINSRMRTFDAFDVSASVGWNDDVNANGVDMHDQSFNGKVSFTMKLGAALPKRFEHEAAAKSAKLRAIKEEEGGALWQVAILRRAHERAIEGLVLQQGKLDEAIHKADELRTCLPASTIQSLNRHSSRPSCS